MALIGVCLIPLEGPPDFGISFADKIFHSLVYFVLTFLWFYSLIFHFKIEKGKAVLYASFISIIFGIIIEILQEVFTDTRQADLLDVVANSLGVVTATGLLALKKRNSVKKL